MRTMHSVLKRGGLYWDRDVLPPAAYEARFRQLQAAVRSSGDAAWLLFGDVERYGAVTFATNFMPRVRSALAFVPVEGPPVLFANCGKRDVPAAKTITWVEEVIPFGRLPGDLIKFIEARNLQASRIGLAGFDRSIPVADWEAIATGLPQAVWTSRDPELWHMRQAKEAWEIEAIARSARIADQALALAPDVLKPGVTMREVIATIDRTARAAGAEDVRYMVASGPQAGVALRPVDDRQLEAGDTVLIYAALEAQRYWAETARTFVLGRAPAALMSLHEKAIESVVSMRSAAQPGVAASALLAASPVQPAYGCGNAIGLDAEEFPIIEAGVTTALERSTTLALRALHHAQGLGVAVAQTVVVEQGGARPINALAPLMEIGL